MAKFAQGEFIPKNPHKYVGKSTIRYRSSWELVFCQFCDNNNSVLQWSSESIRIPYRHPLTGKQTIYVPDFLVVYVDKNGKQIAELIEIKPKKQTMIENNNASTQLRATVAVNHAKWQSANAWCRKMGVTFRIITENDLFHNGSR